MCPGSRRSAACWARKPTRAELTTLAYDPKDIPATLDVRNAEVRIYHMWDESLWAPAANDPARHILTFARPSKSPARGLRRQEIRGLQHPLRG